MNPKTILFVSSVVTVVGAVIGFATLGAIAKVPSGEYWMVVLGCAVVGAAWLALITGLHHTSRHD